MSLNQNCLRPQSVQTEKNKSLRQNYNVTASKGDLLDNSSDNDEKQETKFEQNVNLNQKQMNQMKQSQKRFIRKDQRFKNKIQNPLEQNTHNQLISFEEDEVQITQEINHKKLLKTNHKHIISIKGYKENSVERMQVIENQLRLQQQDIEILKQSQSKEEIQKNDFRLSQFIEIKIKEQYSNNTYYLDQLFENYLKSINLNKMQNQKFDEQQEQENILDTVSRQQTSLNMKIDQDISKLTSQLNQINQTTETLENDLLQLKINQKNISKQSNFQKEQQISFSQITQQLCKFDENVKDIKIYIDNHLKILDSTINSEKEIQNQKINQIQQNIKNELLQVRLDNKNFIQQLKQSQNDINTNQADLININNNIQNENILIIQKKCDQINNINSDPLRSQSIKIYINQLYDESSRKRDTAKEYQYYLRKVQSDEELFQYYRIQNAQQQMELRKYCSSFRQVRGDGNCFYSAFGFQYLELIIRFSNMEFDTLKNQILGKFTCQINYETFHSDQIPNFSNQLIFEFIYRIEQIRQIKDLNQRQLQLEQQFAAHDEENEGIDGCFYGIAIIFFRSLSNHLFQNSEMYLAISAFNNILIWEQEFNSTELIISELAKFLNIHVVLLFFDKNGFKVQEYQPQNQDKIILLIRPGHYNIGIQ